VEVGAKEMLLCLVSLIEFPSAFLLLLLLLPFLPISLFRCQRRFKEIIFIISKLL